MTTPVGIDLGTTFSSISCYKHGSTEIINDDFSERHIPSVVYYNPTSGEAAVGKVAYDYCSSCPGNLVKDAKRIIGRKYNDQQIYREHLNYKLVKTDAEMAAFQIEINNKPVLKTPEEVSADILKYLVDNAEKYLGEKVCEAVISIPANFSGAQRKATLKAADLVGIKVLKLISEPVAAALHYITDKDISGQVLVFDFGGGTLDVSIIEVNKEIFQVKAVYGDTLLGGRNIDKNLFKRFYVPIERFKDRQELRSKIRLEKKCIFVKETLSAKDKVRTTVDDYDEDFDLELNLNKEEFEDINREVFEKCTNLIKVCLNDTKCSKEHIQKVILVGGSSRIPKIRNILEDLFGVDKVMKNLNPEEAVAHGACFQAAVIKKGRSLEKYLIREVTPLSLGISNFGNLMSVFIPKNSPIPTEYCKTMGTSSNNQKSAVIPIYEGERKNCQYNNKLGTFTLQNLPETMAGNVTIAITFSLDQNGVLTVSASELSTGATNSLSVSMSEFVLSLNQVNHNTLESLTEREDDELFEKFTLTRNKLIHECRRLEYDNSNDSCRQKCQNFISYAESVNYRCLAELNQQFQQLKLEITLQMFRELLNQRRI